MIEIHRFDPHHATPAAWADLHAFRRQVAEEDSPGEPMLDDADFEYNARHHWPLQQNHRILARCDGKIVGNLGFSVRREGTQDYDEFARFLGAWGGVLRAHRRRGIATALLHPLLAFMQDHGKTIVSFGTHVPDGHGFLAAIGAREHYRAIENRMEFAGRDWNQLTTWQDAAIPVGSGLRWEVHAGRVPLDRLAALLPQLSALLGDVPLGTLEVPPARYEMPRTLAWYEELDRHGGEHWLVLLTDGDNVAAMCEASWDARFPDRVYQALTAVARPWRGKGLAKGIKAATLRLLRERHPELRLMITSNAEVNAPMLAINQRLGFRVHQRSSGYQLGRDELAAWLATRG
jgi:RimJ/RimL family protein N-acetyltransferase